MGLSGGDWKALYQAATRGDVAEVNQWLEAGVEPNYQHPEFGTTPLIAAAERGQLDAVKALVAKGATPGVRSEWDGWTAEQAAQKGGHLELAQWLRDRAVL